eukprot:PhF_6_TR35183/c0_g1_i2/m.51253
MSSPDSIVVIIIVVFIVCIIVGVVGAWCLYRSLIPHRKLPPPSRRTSIQESDPLPRLDSPHRRFFSALFPKVRNIIRRESLDSAPEIPPPPSPTHLYDRSEKVMMPMFLLKRAQRQVSQGGCGSPKTEYGGLRANKLTANGSLAADPTRTLDRMGNHDNVYS